VKSVRLARGVILAILVVALALAVGELVSFVAVAAAPVGGVQAVQPTFIPIATPTPSVYLPLVGK
jgi:asparagine N-glycosylation enzyme membrane subunit Stt3